MVHSASQNTHREAEGPVVGRRLRARRELRDLMTGQVISRGEVVTLLTELVGGYGPVYRVQAHNGLVSDWADHCFRAA